MKINTLGGNILFYLIYSLIALLLLLFIYFTFFLPTIINIYFAIRTEKPEVHVKSEFKYLEHYTPCYSAIKLSN
jgi:hypothetical protein